MELNGKTAIVTGVSKGIGKAVVQQLLEAGCKVAGLGMTQPDYKHDNFIFIKTDVRDYKQVEAAFVQVKERFGEELHILMNNAGLGYFGYLEDTTLEQWHQLYDTNVSGTFYCCKLVLPQMKKQEYGHIINIASVAGLEGYPQVGAYCSSKFAVRGLSESLYKEVRDFRIKVTCVYPGSVKTDFFRNSPGIKPHDYMLMPEDVATAIKQILETPDNYHTVNYEIRPLQPKGPRKN
ncbi:MAG TPA: SDR family oxidoreductase [Bacteroidia bacterium]|nr:SDR family oxidoreductase [Bacteroidia bacterium]